MRRPDENLQFSRKMQERGPSRQGNTHRSRHRINLNLSFGVLQGPWLVVDLSPIHIPSSHTVEAVTIGQPRFQSVFLPDLNRPNRAITPMKFRVRPLAPA